MASLVKVPTSKYWIAAFRDASGRQHRRTTREIDRKRAQVVADKYERVAQRKGSPQRVRQILSEFSATTTAKPSPLLQFAITHSNGLPPGKPKPLFPRSNAMGEPFKSSLRFSALTLTKLSKKSRAHKLQLSGTHEFKRVRRSRQTPT